MTWIETATTPWETSSRRALLGYEELLHQSLAERSDTARGKINVPFHFDEDEAFVLAGQHDVRQRLTSFAADRFDRRKGYGWEAYPFCKATRR